LALSASKFTRNLVPIEAIEGRTMQPDNDREFLTTAEVAARFGLTQSWLNKNRIYAQGPELLPFVSVGSKKLYSVSTVRAWLAAREKLA
jgi:hypothetical protein